jgi:hypothetical protein
LHFLLPMELIADTKLVFSAQYFPTSTPILDVLRPLPVQQRDRLSTGSYFLISSAIILGVSEIYLLRSFADSVAALQSGALLGMTFFLLPCFAFLAAIAAHEAGHLVAGRIAGFEPVRIKIGPFSFATEDGRQKLRCEEILPLGFAVLRPKSKDRLERRLLYLVLGGPLANLLAPLLLESVFDLLPATWGTGYFVAAFAVHIFSVVALLFGIASLLPDTDASGNFTDGARIVMLLKNDLRAARWLAIIQLQLALNQGEHPRDWDENLVNRAVAVKDDSLGGRTPGINSRHKVPGQCAGSYGIVTQQLARSVVSGSCDISSVVSAQCSQSPVLDLSNWQCKLALSSAKHAPADCPALGGRAFLCRLGKTG